MIDPITAVATATAAFNTIKKGGVQRKTINIALARTGVGKT